MRSRRWGQGALAVMLLALTMAGWWQGTPAQAATRQAASAPVPFLSRPYYGSATVLSRAISLFDHDQPWYDSYATDGKFVRYDGLTATANAMTNCTPYVNCYDGHNGYDLNLLFEPVLAASAGTVIRAGWYDAANHSDGFGLWVAIDHGNGYYTSYGHMSAVTVTVGQAVQAQWQIGTSGSTGAATGPHMHFSVWQAATWRPVDPFGWQTTAFADPNVVPDSYMWVGAPMAATQSPCLGCQSSQVAFAGATVVDDGAAGFQTTGGPWYTATGSGLVNGTMHWANTVASGAPTATAAWTPTLPAPPAAFEVGVYIDPVNASTQWAPYTITSLDAAGKPQTTTVWVDQMHVGNFTGPFGPINTGPRWVSLGTYRFGAGVGRVTVSNVTGEVGQQLGADAVEFVPAPGGLPTTGNVGIVPPSQRQTGGKP